jgi:hypothetical protein
MKLESTEILRLIWSSLAAAAWVGQSRWQGMGRVRAGQAWEDTRQHTWETQAFAQAMHAGPAT